MIKVVQIIDRLEAGGAEKIAISIANELAKQDFKSYVCTTRSKGTLVNELIPDVQKIHLKKKFSLDLKTVFSFSKIIRKEKIQVLHAHSTSLFFAFLTKLFVSNTAIIWHVHSGSIIRTKGLKLIVLKIISLFVNRIITVNSEIETWLQTKLNCKDIHVLNNFADLNIELEQTILNGKEGKRIVNVAGFRHEKDHLNLLYAFKEVVAFDSDVTLHLIGKDYKDEYSKSINKTIKDLQLEEHVFLYGMRRDIDNIIKQSTIGVISSHSEGLPVSVIEFASLGLPFVSTDVGGIHKVLKNKELLIEPKSPKALAKSLILLLSDVDLQTNESNKLKKLAQQFYSLKSFMSNLINIYESSVKH